MFKLFLNPLMEEDGAGMAAPSEGSLFDDGGSSGEGDSSPNEPVSEPENTPPPEKTFTQAELDRIIGDRLNRERQRYAPMESLMQDAAKQYGFDNVQAYMDAVRQNQQEQQKQKYYDAGLDPDLVSEVVAQHPAVQWAQSFMSQQQQEQFFNAQAQELLQAYPDLDSKNIPPEVFQLNAQGISLLDAYNRVMLPKIRQDQTKLKDEAIKEYLSKKSGKAPGVTEGAGSAPVLEYSSPKNFNDAKTQALAYLKSLKDG